MIFEERRRRKLENDRFCDRDGPYERHRSDDDTENERHAGGRRGIGSVRSPGGEDDHRDRGEQSSDERGERAGPIVSPDRASVDDEIGDGERDQRSETANDAEKGSHSPRIHDRRRTGGILMAAFEGEQKRHVAPSRGAGMGLGSTTKKLQRVAEMAETLYQKVDELRTQVNEVKDHVETTSQRVERIEHDLDEQRAVLDALAREQGIDVDATAAGAAIEEAESEHGIENAESTADGTDADDSGPDEPATAEQ